MSSRRLRYPNSTRVGDQLVRYRYEFDPERLRRMVKRARGQKGGKATFGPITVTVHPDDRA